METRCKSCSAERRRRVEGVRPRQISECELFSEADWLVLGRILRLTKRQLQIARLLSQELSYQQTAQRLGISINTVRMHMRALFRKLNVHGRVGIVLRLAMAQRKLESRSA
jgi:DNA-binding CsgD family transcriptional regulator